MKIGKFDYDYEKKVYRHWFIYGNVGKVKVSYFPTLSNHSRLGDDTLSFGHFFFKWSGEINLFMYFVLKVYALSLRFLILRLKVKIWILKYMRKLNDFRYQVFFHQWCVKYWKVIRKYYF